MQTSVRLLRLSVLVALIIFMHSAFPSVSATDTVTSSAELPVEKRLAERPVLDLISWSLGSFGNTTRRVIRQLEVQVRNASSRIIGIFRPDEAYQECTTPGGKKGRCRHLQYCLFGEHRKLRTFLEYSCIIENRYVGVCCPEGQENGGVESDGLPGSEAAGQLPAIDPGLPGSSHPGNTSAPPVPGNGSVQPQLRGCGVSTVNKSRIIQGQPADPGEWPWMVTLLKDTGSHFCGGALITDRHVLTAAHCVIGRTTINTKVRLGEYDLTRFDETRAQDFNLAEIRMHVNFSRTTYENDIAILKLDRRAAFNSYIWPICLPPPGPSFENKMAVVAGWGRLTYGGELSPVLMEVTLPVWHQRNCTSRFAQPIMDTAMCAGAYEGGKDSCQGDSGGPLMLQLESGRWATIGVVSWGVRCAEPNTPGIYTRVNRYLQWIVENSVF